MKKTTVQCKVGQNEIILETGLMAKQADGAVVASCGNNIVLATVVSSKQASQADFFPLTIEYQERLYASGKIPGSYFKREGRPTELNILNCRLIDRPLRPLFPPTYIHETQIVAIVLSFDGLFPVNILAGIASSAALHISNIPFAGPVCFVQLSRLNKEMVLNPSSSQVKESDINMVIAGTKKGLLMVEGEANLLKESEVLQALKSAHQSFLPIIEAQEDLRSKVGQEKRTFNPLKIDESLQTRVKKAAKDQIISGVKIKSKQERYERLSAIKTEIIKKFTDELPDNCSEKTKEEHSKMVQTIYDNLKYEIVRSMILNEGVRIDGRNSDQIRNIECEVGFLPRTHGSGLFTRGETQVLGTVTLGTSDDAQNVDTLHGNLSKRFLLHYNFPPFCVGETGRLGGQSRREIGHGFLAERSLVAILPDEEKFPYVMRIVSEVLESNGSSSMGTVCSAMLALLDAGVPVKGNVAGIAMGLIKGDDNKMAILSDILGDEDHLGDMDFKVAGTKDGISALQMDIKIDNIDFDTIEKALMQAKEGRATILDEMEQVISHPRSDLSEFAPRIETLKINVDKIRDVIGPSGRKIKEIIAMTGVKIDITDDGIVNVISSNLKERKQALEIIKNIVADPEIGKVYEGKVVKVTDFGAFVEILANTTGLLHISEIANERVMNVTDYIKEGEKVNVKVLDIDRTGRIKLSRKVLL